jgi:tetratricopeptide (TPR) repeat protein
LAGNPQANIKDDRFLNPEIAPKSFGNRLWGGLMIVRAKSRDDVLLEVNSDLGCRDPNAVRLQGTPIGGAFRDKTRDLLAYLVGSGNNIVPFDALRQHVWKNNLTSAQTIDKTLREVKATIVGDWLTWDTRKEFIYFHGTPAETSADSASLRFVGPSAPPARGDFFGRSQELAEMRHFFSGKAPTKGATLVLEGSPGSGKTQLARQFIEEYGDSYDIACWIGSSRGAKYWDTSVQQAQDVRTIAIELGLPGAANVDVATHEVRELLSRELKHYKRRLIILDNVDSTESVSRLESIIGKSHVIITTVLHAWVSECIAVGHRIDLDQHQFDQTLGTNFLLSRSGRHSRLDALYARRVGNALGWHALALEQAAAFVGARGITFREYLKRLRKQPIPLLQAYRPKVYDQSVLATFSVLIDHLRTTAPLAYRALLIASFFAPDRVPVHQFCEARTLFFDPTLFYANFWDNEAFEGQCLVPLRDLSLLMPGNEGAGSDDTRRIHRVVVYLLHSSNLEYDPVYDVMGILFSVGPGDDLSMWYRNPWLLPNAMTVLEHLFELGDSTIRAGLDRLARRLIHLFIHAGEYPLAHTVLERSISFVEHALNRAPKGDRHWEGLCRSALSKLLPLRVDLNVALSSEAHSKGDDELARRFDEESLLSARQAAANDALRFDDPNNPSVKSLRCVGCRTLALGDVEEAIAMITSALTAREACLNDLFVKRGLSLSSWYSGEQIEIEIVEGYFVYNLIDDHYLLGVAEFTRGALDKAEIHFRRSLRCATGIRDKYAHSTLEAEVTHLAVTKCSIGLGDCLAAAGRADESRGLLESAAQLLRKSLIRANCSIDLPATRERLRAPRPLGLESYLQHGRDNLDMDMTL